MIRGPPPRRRGFCPAGGSSPRMTAEQVETSMQIPSRNPHRSVDLCRRRRFRARSPHADRRRAATAVVVSRRSRSAGQHRRGGTGGGKHLAIAQRTIAGRRGRYAPRRGRMPLRALSARRRQAAGPGMGRHRRHLQDRRRPLRAAAYQFPASPRRRLQGPQLQTGARRGAGRTDAVGRRDVRNRGLRRRLRGRADAFA